MRYYLVRIAIIFSLFALSLFTYSLATLRSYRGSLKSSKNPVDSFAYVFYATSNLYACSALVNVHRLRRLFRTPHPIYLLASNGVSKAYVSIFWERYNVTIIEHQPPPLPPNSAPYYQDVLLKLVSFGLHHWAPRVKRIIVLDSDQLILRSLDDVFTKVPPEVEVAAPQAYWYDEPFATSALMMVSLSEPLWERMNSSLVSIAADKYDMDIINAEFKDEIMLLPGEYVTLNSHWETKGIPAWSRFRKDYIRWPLEGRKSFTEKSQSNQGKREGRLGNSPSVETSQYPKQRASAVVKNTTNSHQLSYDHALFDPLTLIFYTDVYVLHYTALGKPWSSTVDDVHEQRPESHPLFAEQFLLWRTAAKYLCPALDPGDNGAYQIAGKAYFVDNVKEVSKRFLDEI